jgi:integrase
MELPLKRLIDECFIRKKSGTCIVYIQYQYTTLKRTLLSTEIPIPPVYWNYEEGFISDDLPVQYGNAEELNTELRRMYRAAEDIVLFASKNKLARPGEFAKKTFSPRFDPQTLKDLGKQMEYIDVRTNLDIWFQIDEYILSKSKKVSQGVSRIHRNMKYHLLEYAKVRGRTITFDCLDFNFYEDFVNFLIYEYVQIRSNTPIVGLKANTVGKIIKHFRTFIRNRIRRKIIAPIDMQDWDILEEDADTIYLSFEEIEAIRTCDLGDHAHLSDYRDELVLGCLTGLRFSDFSNIQENDIRGDLLYKKAQKVNARVVIPLQPAAVGILKRKFSKGLPPTLNQVFNRHVKTICKLAGIDTLIKHSYKKGNKIYEEVLPKYEWVSSHTCRRSFCTNEFLAGTPVELIMKISGHKSVKDFYKYIRITPEEAALRIKEIWNNREELVKPTKKEFPRRKIQLKSPVLN